MAKMFLMEEDINQLGEVIMPTNRGVITSTNKA